MIASGLHALFLSLFCENSSITSSTDTHKYRHTHHAYILNIHVICCAALRVCRYPWHVVFTGIRILFESGGIFDGDYFANDDNGQYIGYQLVHRHAGVPFHCLFVKHLIPPLHSLHSFPLPTPPLPTPPLPSPGGSPLSCT